MEEPQKIWVVDDEEAFSANVQGHIERMAPEARVRHVDSLGLGRLLSVLHKRRDSERSGDTPPTDECILDDADIAVIDYDLAGVQAAAVADGEMLAYLARAYSTCGLIVELNRFGVNSFDLTLDQGAMGYADLYIGFQQLASPFLWTETHGDGLTAWSWPCIPSAARALYARTNWILEHLDTQLHDAFEDLFTHAMPRDVLAALGDSHDGTWRTWAASKAFLQRKDVDSARPDETLARIAAARVSHWLERIVLPTQDLLVDAPHLVARYPGLLEDPTAGNDWNSTCLRGGLSPRMKSAALEGSLLANWGLWLSRPAWLWPRTRETAQDQAWGPVPKDSLNWAFCEDTSEFVPTEDAKPFVCDLRTPFTRRFVRRLPSIDYQPAVRLLSGQP